MASLSFELRFVDPFQDGPEIDLAGRCIAVRLGPDSPLEVVASLRQVKLGKWPVPLVYGEPEVAPVISDMRHDRSLVGRELFQLFDFSTQLRDLRPRFWALLRRIAGGSQARANGETDEEQARG